MDFNTHVSTKRRKRTKKTKKKEHLSSHIKHLELVAVDLEIVLDNSRSPHAGSQHILLRGQVALRGHLVELLEEVLCRVGQLKLGAVLKSLLDARILPKSPKKGKLAPLCLKKTYLKWPTFELLIGAS